MTVTNKAFRQAMEKAGLGKIELCKNRNYFYIYSEDEDTMFRILSEVENNMILCHAFNDMTIDGWIDTIKRLFGFYHEDLMKVLTSVNNDLANMGMKIEELGSFYTYHPGFTLSVAGRGGLNVVGISRLAEGLQEASRTLDSLNDVYKGRKILFRN